MKLGAVAIFVVGIAISLSILSIAFFQYWSPNQRDASMYRKYGDELQTEADKLPKAKKRLQEAHDLVQKSMDDWQKVVDARSPATSVKQGGIDLAVDSYKLVDDARTYRDNLQLAVNHQLKIGGVKLPQGGPYIPDTGPDQTQILANFFNYPAVAFPVVILDLGQINVEGTYDQIIANYRGWSHMPHYMTLVDNLQFRGTSPHMFATYNVQILGYIHAKDIFPPAPDSGAAAAATGVPGAAPGAATDPGEAARQAQLAGSTAGAIQPGRGGPPLGR